MKLDFNFDLKDLEDNNFKDLPFAGKVLANGLALTASTKIKAMDAYEYSLKLKNGEILDLTTNQQDELKYFIENEMRASPIIAAQLLMVFKKEPKKVEE